MGTLLSICKDVADDVTVDRPSAIALSNEDTARKLLASAKAAGQSIMRAHDWDSLVKEHTFATVASTVNYSLPTDFDRLVSNTLWDRSNYEEMQGALSAERWQEYQSSTLATSATIWKQFRIRDVSGTVQFSIFPTPTGADNLVFEYVSKNWCKSTGGTPQATWAADTDEPIINENLLFLGIRYRFLNRMGMDYAEEKQEYLKELAQLKARDSGNSPSIYLSRRSLKWYINTPETGFGS